MLINKSYNKITSLSLAVLAVVIGTLVLVLFLSVSSGHSAQQTRGSVVGAGMDNSCGCVTHQGRSFLVAPNIYIGPRNASTISGIPPMSPEHLDKGNYIAWVAGGFASADFAISTVDEWANSPAEMAAEMASKAARSTRNLGARRAEENTANEENDDDDDDDESSTTNKKTSTLQEHTTFLLEERIEALKAKQVKQDARISELEKLVMDLMSEKIQVHVDKPSDIRETANEGLYTT
jgi:hypothetical protein